MEENKLRSTVLIAAVAAVVLIMIIVGVKSYNENEDPAVDRLRSINDSLYDVIDQNNQKTDSLFIKIDSLNIHQDTIIQNQQITNEIYRNETYNILSSSPSNATAQFRATLKKSDSLLKAGFYTRTYNLRSATFQSQLQ
jgi:predicted PurR-regulated permease PerM